MKFFLLVLSFVFLLISSVLFVLGIKILLAFFGARKEVRKNKEFLSLKSEILKYKTFDELHTYIAKIKVYTFDLRKYSNDEIRALINLNLTIILCSLIIKRMEKIISDQEKELRGKYGDDVFDFYSSR